jgi:hypothetical protein
MTRRIFVERWSLFHVSEMTPQKTESEAAPRGYAALTALRGHYILDVVAPRSHKIVRSSPVDRLDSRTTHLSRA